MLHPLATLPKENLMKRGSFFTENICSTSREWKYLRVSLMLFGYAIPETKDTSTFIGKLLIAVCKAVRVFFYSVCVVCTLGMIYTFWQPMTKYHFVHSIDGFMVSILHCLLDKRAKDVLEKVEEFGCAKPKKEDGTCKFSRLSILLLFALMSFILIYSLISSFVEGFHLRYVIRYTFGTVENITLTEYPLLLEIYVFAISNSWFVWFGVVPCMASFISCMALLESRQYVKFFNETFEEKLKCDWPDNIASISQTVRKMGLKMSAVNSLTSSPIFFFIAFSIIHTCYIVSKIIAPMDDLVHLTLTAVGRSVCFFLGFVLLVLLADWFHRETLRTRIILLQYVGEREDFRDSRTTNKIVLLLSLLKHFSKEASVYPLGMFKLERSFILVIFGVIISYEVMIFQLTIAS